MPEELTNQPETKINNMKLNAIHKPDRTNLTRLAAQRLETIEQTLRLRQPGRSEGTSDGALPLPEIDGTTRTCG